MFINTLQNYETIIILLIIIIIILSLAVFRLSKPTSLVDNQVQEEIESLPKRIIYKENSRRKIDDIQDEDMLVAILVATIDFTEDTKTDAKLVSIKQII